MAEIAKAARALCPDTKEPGTKNYINTSKPVKNKKTPYSYNWKNRGGQYGLK